MSTTSRLMLDTDGGFVMVSRLVVGPVGNVTPSQEVADCGGTAMIGRVSPPMAIDGIIRLAPPASEDVPVVVSRATCGCEAIGSMLSRPATGR